MGKQLAGASLGLAVPQWQGAGMLGTGTVDALRGQAMRGVLVKFHAHPSS